MVPPLCLYPNLYPRLFLEKFSHQFALLYLWVKGRASAALYPLTIAGQNRHKRVFYRHE